MSYRTVDGRRKTIKEMIEDIDDAEKKLGYSPTWSGPTTRRVEYGLDRYKAHRIEGLDRRDVRRALKEELERGGLPEDFHYPCHTDEGTGLVRLGLHPGPHGDHAEDQATEPGTPWKTRQTGWLNRKTDEDGLRWWWWEDMEGREGKRLPSYQQALLDFIETTKE